MTSNFFSSFFFVCMFSVYLCPFWYWCYYPHQSKDSVYPVCRIFFTQYLEYFYSCLLAITLTESTQYMKINRGSALPSRFWFEQPFQYISKNIFYRIFFVHQKWVWKFGTPKNKVTKIFSLLSKLCATSSVCLVLFRYHISVLLNSFTQKSWDCQE